MGCASSSPMMNGSGGIVGAAKNAASDVVHAGEEVLHGNPHFVRNIFNYYMLFFILSIFTNFHRYFY